MIVFFALIVRACSHKVNKSVSFYQRWWSSNALAASACLVAKKNYSITIMQIMERWRAARVRTWGVQYAHCSGVNGAASPHRTGKCWNSIKLLSTSLNGRLPVKFAVSGGWRRKTSYNTPKKCMMVISCTPLTSPLASSLTSSSEQSVLLARDSQFNQCRWLPICHCSVWWPHVPSGARQRRTSSAGCWTEKGSQSSSGRHLTLKGQSGVGYVRMVSGNR